MPLTANATIRKMTVVTELRFGPFLARLFEAAGEAAEAVDPILERPPGLFFPLLFSMAAAECTTNIYMLHSFAHVHGTKYKQKWEKIVKSYFHVTSSRNGPPFFNFFSLSLFFSV